MTVAISDETRAPRLLPGLSAQGWTRVISVLFVIPMAVFAAVVVAQIADGGQFPSWALTALIPAGIFAWVIALSARAMPFERRETAAGYTTLYRSHPELPQLDSRTGEVIRAAGAPYLTSAQRKARRRGSRDAVTDHVVALPVARPGLIRRYLYPILSLLVVLIVGFAGSFARLSHEPGGFAISLGISIGAFVVLIISFAIATAVGRSRMQRFTAAAPVDAFIFRFRRNNSRSDALTVAMENLHRPDAATGPWAASADASGFMIWRGDDPELELALAWGSITSIQRDQISGGQSSTSSVLVTIRDANDALTSMQLVAPTISALPLPSRAETDWIVARLNALRTGTTTARLI